MKKINIGIIGAGHIAAKVSKTLQKMPRIHCLAVASRDLEKARAFAIDNGYKKAYGSYEELVKDADLDLIYIATPHSHHFENSKLCLENGKNVICEKAFTTTAAQASELISIAKKNKVLLTEAMWTRYMPFSTTIHNVMNSGLIGDPKIITVSLGYSILWKNRITDPALGGGALLDLGVYCINFVLMNFGDRIKNIKSSCIKGETGVDLQESITFEYEDGKMAVMSVSACACTDRTAVIAGSEGRIVIDNVNNPRKLTVYDRMDRILDIHEAPDCITGYEYEFEAACNALENGLTECPEMPLSASLKIMQIMDSLRSEWGVRFPADI